MVSYRSSVSRAACSLTCLKCLWDEEEAWSRVIKAGCTPPVCRLNQSWEKYLHEAIDTTASGGSVVSLCAARINFCSSNLSKLFLIVCFSQNPSEREWRGCYHPQWQKRSAGWSLNWVCLCQPWASCAEVSVGAGLDWFPVEVWWGCGVQRRAVVRGGTFWDVFVVLYLLSDHQNKIIMKCWSYLPIFLFLGVMSCLGSIKKQWKQDLSW